MFAQHLRDRADQFREKKLNSNDIQDKTIYAEDWREQVPEDDSALGGPYLAMHMRRGDFSYAHKETVPSIEEVGKEMAKRLKEYKLKKVYLSTDGTDEGKVLYICLLYTSPSPRDGLLSRMPSSA